MKNIFYQVSLAAAVFLSGCANEWLVSEEGSDDGVAVRVNLDVPGGATRGLTDAQQRAVRTIDVFVFDEASRLVDWRYGRLDANGSEFEAQLTPGKNGERFRLMVLANVRTTTYNLFGDGIGSGSGNVDLGGHKGKSYAEIVKLLETAVPSYDNVLQNGLPMWGELEESVELKNNATNTLSITLLRSMARVDVGTHPNPGYDSDGKITGWEALSNFSLEEVHVFKANTHYAIAPNRDVYDFDDKSVHDYTLPANKETFSPYTLLYSDEEQGDGTVTRNAADKGVALTGSIFLGETDVKMTANGTYGDENHTERIALVVGGHYAGRSEMSYYRLDFLDEGSDTDLRDILRNNDYQIVITSCSGPGKPTPDDAYETKIVDMTFVVVPWNEAQQDHDLSENMFHLWVNSSFLRFGYRASTQTLEVDTDYTSYDVPISYPAGWKVAKIEYLSGGTGWITSPTLSTTGGTGKTSIDITVAENPNFSSFSSLRSARITIKAGNMSKYITVWQHERTRLRIDVQPEEFTEENGAYQDYLFRQGEEASYTMTIRASLTNDSGLINGNDPITYTWYYIARPHGTPIGAPSRDPELVPSRFISNGGRSVTASAMWIEDFDDNREKGGDSAIFYCVVSSPEAEESVTSDMIRTDVALHIE